MELYKKSAAELSALLRSKEVTACEILDDTLARIDADAGEFCAAV